MPFSERCIECSDLILGISYVDDNQDGPYCWKCYTNEQRDDEDDAEERERDRATENRIAMEVDHE